MDFPGELERKAKQEAEEVLVRQMEVENKQRAIKEKFHTIQTEIRNSVERADQAMTQYEFKARLEEEIREAEEAKREARSANDRSVRPIPKNLDELVPVVEKFAILRIGEAHEETMARLVDMYNSYQTFMSEASDDLDGEQFDVDALFADIAAHREAIVQKVETAQEQVVKQRKEMEERREREAQAEADLEAAIRVEKEGEAGYAPDASGPQSGSQGDKLSKDQTKILKEQVRVLEAHAADLNAELDEERDAYKAMDRAKDDIIHALKRQFEDHKEQMAEEWSRTSLELAEGASQVEDTRLHIAKLTVQLRNARELAAARDLDSSNWVKASDHHVLVEMWETKNSLCEKLNEEVEDLKEEHELNQEKLRKMMHDRARVQQQHDKLEMELRESLLKREEEVQKLSLETRLLQSRADKIQLEMELKRQSWDKDAKRQIEEAIGVMEDQRGAFNNALETRDMAAKNWLSDLERADAALEASEAKREELKKEIQAAKQAEKERVLLNQKEERERILRNRDGVMQTEFAVIDKKLPDPKLATKDPLSPKVKVVVEKGPETGTATQTGSVAQTLWRVCRRRLAISAIHLGERRTNVLKKVVDAASDFEDELDERFQTQSAIVKAASTNIGKHYDQLHASAASLRTLLTAVHAHHAYRPVALGHRMRVAAAMTTALESLAPHMQAAGVNMPGELVGSGSGKFEEHKGPSLVEKHSSQLEEILELLQKDEGAVQQVGLECTGLMGALEQTLKGDHLHHLQTMRQLSQEESLLRTRENVHDYIETLEAVKEGQTADDVANPKEAHSPMVRDHEVKTLALQQIIETWNKQREGWIREKFALNNEIKALSKKVLEGGSPLEMAKTASSISAASPISKVSSSEQIAKTASAASYSAQVAADYLEELQGNYDRLKLQREMHGAMAVGLEVSMLNVKNALHSFLEEHTKPGGQHQAIELAIFPATEVAVPALWHEALGLAHMASLALAKLQNGAPASVEAEMQTEGAIDTSHSVGGTPKTVVDPAVDAAEKAAEKKRHAAALANQAALQQKLDVMEANTEAMMEEITRLHGVHQDDEKGGVSESAGNSRVASGGDGAEARKDADARETTGGGDVLAESPPAAEADVGVAEPPAEATEVAKAPTDATKPGNSEAETAVPEVVSPDGELEDVPKQASLLIMMQSTMRLKLQALSAKANIKKKQEEEARRKEEEKRSEEDAKRAAGVRAATPVEYQAEMDRLAAELESSTLAMAEGERQAAAMQHQLQGAIDAGQEELARAKQDLDATREEVERLTQEVNAVTQEVNAAQQTHSGEREALESKFEREVAALEKRFEGESERLHTANAELREESVRLHTANSELQSAEEARESRTQGEEEAREAREKLTAAFASLEKLQDKASTLEMGLETEKKNRQKHETRADKAEEEVVEMKGELRLLQEKFGKMTSNPSVEALLSNIRVQEGVSGGGSGSWAVAPTPKAVNMKETQVWPGELEEIPPGAGSDSFRKTSLYSAPQSKRPKLPVAGTISPMPELSLQVLQVEERTWNKEVSKPPVLGLEKPVLGFVPRLDLPSLPQDLHLTQQQATARADRIISMVDSEFDLFDKEARAVGSLFSEAPSSSHPRRSSLLDPQIPRPPPQGSLTERRGSSSRRKRLVEAGRGPPKDVLDPWTEAYGSGRKPAPRQAVLEAATMGRLPALFTTTEASETPMGRRNVRRTGW